MERIQYAIAKARAERSAQGATSEPQSGADQGPAREPSGTAATSHSGAAFARAQPGVRLSTPVPPAGGLQKSASGVEAATALPGADAPHPEAKTLRIEGVTAAWRALRTLRINERRARSNLIVSLGGSAPGAAEVDGIRTRLLQHLASRGMVRVAITSPGPNCGKSTVALNLGFSLGRQPDQRTIVADVDLRRPHMAKTLGLKEKHSAAQVLAGESPFEDNALRHGPNLAFATTHASARNSAELLQSRGAGQVLDDIQARYAPTVMLFDLPPLLVNDDAMAFLGQVDCALIIAAAEKTTVKEIDRCEREVASQTSVLGVILNRCRYMDKSDGYSEYYS